MTTNYHPAYDPSAPYVPGANLPDYVPPPVWTPRPAVPVRPPSGVSVSALILGIAGVVLGLCTFGLPNIAAVILGHMGLADTKDGTKSGRGMAIAGLVMGYVTLAPAIVFSVWVLVGAVTSAA